MSSAPKQANFRSYEAQARLLAAVIATAQPRLDYKAIARHIGSDATPSSVDHRLRPMKQLAQLQKRCVAQDKDPALLPIEKAEIQKLFGESTSQGLEFHFREVKAIGRAQQDAVKNGKSPIDVPIGPIARTGGAKGKARAQPPPKSAPSTPATDRKRAAPSSKGGMATTGGRGRKQPRLEENVTSTDDNSPEEDYDELDQNTPSKSRARAERNPAYAVNNSTTNSENGSPMPTLTAASYAVTQAQAQAQARARYPPEFFHGTSYDDDDDQPNDNNNKTDIVVGATSQQSQPQHQSIFGGDSSTMATAIPGTSLSSAPTRTIEPADDDDDDIMEINSNQYTSSISAHHGNNTTQGIRGGGSHAKVKQPKKKIKAEAEIDTSFDTDDVGSDYVDLTSTSRGRARNAVTGGGGGRFGYGNVPDNPDLSYYSAGGAFGSFHVDSNNNNNHGGDDDDMYGDGEI